jgi:pimeloyl-ACP methyl ester carboxylesterase
MPALQSREVSVAGVRTHYLEGGVAGGEVIVLLHDGMFGAGGRLTWSPVLEMLAERYHVFAPDQLGYGKTQKIYDFGASARSQRIEHLAKWMSVANIRNAHVAGNSASGSLILHAAIHQSWPMRSGVSVAGTGGPFMRTESYEPLQSYVPDRMKMRAIMELMVARRDEIFDRLVDERYEQSLIRGHWENLSAPRLRAPGGGARVAAENDEKFFSELAGVTLPLLFIAGREDTLLESGWESKIAARIPGAKALAIAGALHQPQIDEPQRVHDAIDAFIRALDH